MKRQLYFITYYEINMHTYYNKLLRLRFCTSLLCVGCNLLMRLGDLQSHLRVYIEFSRANRLTSNSSNSFFKCIAVRRCVVV